MHEFQKERVELKKNEIISIEKIKGTTTEKIVKIKNKFRKKVISQYFSELPMIFYFLYKIYSYLKKVMTCIERYEET